MSWKTVEINNDQYTYDYFLGEYVCRICWYQNGDKELSTISEAVETNQTIAEIIYECTGVDLSICPRPTKVCSSCWNEVENLCEFRRFCISTQSKLYNIIQEGSQQIAPQNDARSVEDFAPSEDTEFSNLELSAIDTLFEDLKSDSDVEQPIKKNKKRSAMIKSETYCSLCKIDLGSLDLLTHHNTNIHGLENSLYKCFGCGKTFKNMKQCLKHETENCKALKNGYKCHICGKLLQERRSFEIHLRAHREENGRKEHVLTTPEKIDRNLDWPEELFTCKKCELTFLTIELLNEHITTCDNKKKWVCDTCGRTFMRRDYLNKHKLIHEGKKQHVCPYCGFRTIQKSSLNVHIRKHTGERPHACSLCPQRCVNSSNLHAHMKRHLGIKRFQCQLCGKKFGYKVSLEDHISSIHERPETHSCDVCGATYTRLRGLRRHLSAKHGKQKKSESENQCDEEKAQFEIRERNFDS